MGLRFEPRILATLGRGLGPSALTLSGVVGALFLGGIASADPIESLRYTATVLQVMGGVLVVRDLAKTRGQFGKRPLLAYPKEWFRLLRLVFWKPPPIVAQMGSISASISIGGSARATVGLPDGAPLDERVSKLESDLRELTGQLERTAASIKDEAAKQKEELARRIGELRTSTDAFEKRFEELAVGGAHIELMGLIWLLVGTILGGLPESGLLWLWS